MKNKKLTKRLIGLFLILAGAALAYWGYETYTSFGSKLGSVFGNTPVEAWAGMIGGAICIALGLYQQK